MSFGGLCSEDAFLDYTVFDSSHAEEICSPPCGCFNNDDEPFVDTDLPETWETQGLQFELYTPENPDTHVDILWDNIPSEYDPSRPTRFIIHGWWGQSGEPDTYPRLVKDALLGSGDYNVIVVEWTEGASHLYYPQSAMNTRVIGACAGHMASTLVSSASASWSGMHCIGTSLGGQTCGFMGEATRAQMARATGLDPAGPMFDVTDPRGRIDASDAQFVDNIHSNTNNDFINLGLGNPVGHADFYPNKGGIQPPCDSFVCDHGMATEYMRVSIVEGSRCQYSAYPCNDEDDADNGGCENCIAGTDCQRMGYYANTMPGRGTFFLRTVADYPYCEN
ncbi:unnamed protein product [Owenia fusiformis]|uniref:Uncharacterized protein n=1 Tax=Owenia fusiformis TaxID=6347 RepID=A0A8J1YCA1_OWEFU|nr:unnamed protein product [Owenia fusiformis]